MHSGEPYPAGVGGGLSRFPSVASEAAGGRTYDVEVGVCVTSTDPSLTPNNPPLAAPLACADAVFNISGVAGTSYTVTGLTPGRWYSFRVVTRREGRGREGRESGGGEIGDSTTDSTTTAPPAAADEGAVSALAVAIASFEGGGSTSSGGASPVAGAGNAFDFEDAAVDTTPGLAFCGARRDVFPNGTLLLDGASVLVDTPAACCLACSRTMVK